MLPRVSPPYPPPGLSSARLFPASLSGRPLPPPPPVSLFAPGRSPLSLLPLRTPGKGGILCSQLIVFAPAGWYHGHRIGWRGGLVSAAAAGKGIALPICAGVLFLLTSVVPGIGSLTWMPITGILSMLAYLFLAVLVLIRRRGPLLAAATGLLAVVKILSAFVGGNPYSLLFAITPLVMCILLLPKDTKPLEHLWAIAPPPWPSWSLSGCLI